MTTTLEAPPTLDHEIQAICRALAEHGPAGPAALGQLVGSRYWGPGTFGRALRAAVADGRIRRVSRSVFAMPDTEPGADRPGRPGTNPGSTDSRQDEPPPDPQGEATRC